MPHVVLVHGLIGFGSGIEKQLGIEPGVYFGDIPAALREAGFDVSQPSLPHTAGIVERAAALVQHVWDLPSEQDVHLLAQSG